ELFDMNGLIDAFSIERIGKSGTKFDINKAKWFNQQYLKQKPDAELAGYLAEELAKHGFSCTEEKATQICKELKERVVFHHDLWNEAKFFFIAPDQYDQKVTENKWTEEAVTALSAYKDALKLLSAEVDADTAKNILAEVLEKNNIKMGKVMQA